MVQLGKEVSFVLSYDFQLSPLIVLPLVTQYIFFNLVFKLGG